MSDRRYYHPCSLQRPVPIPRIGRPEVLAIMFAKIGLFSSVLVVAVALILGAVHVGRSYFNPKVRVSAAEIAEVQQRVKNAERTVVLVNNAVEHANYRLTNTGIFNSLFTIPGAKDNEYVLKSFSIKSRALTPRATEGDDGERGAKSRKRTPVLAYAVELVWDIRSPTHSAHAQLLSSTIVAGLRADFAKDGPLQHWTFDSSSHQQQSPSTGGEPRHALTVVGSLSPPPLLYTPKPGRNGDASRVLAAFWGDSSQ